METARFALIAHAYPRDCFFFFIQFACRWLIFNFKQHSNRYNYDSLYKLSTRQELRNELNPTWMSPSEQRHLYTALQKNLVGIPDPTYQSRNKWERPSGPPDKERLGEIRRVSHPQFFPLSSFPSLENPRKAYNSSKILLPIPPTTQLEYINQLSQSQNLSKNPCNLRDYMELYQKLKQRETSLPVSMGSSQQHRTCKCTIQIEKQCGTTYFSNNDFVYFQLYLSTHDCRRFLLFQTRVSSFGASQNAIQGILP